MGKIEKGDFFTQSWQGLCSREIKYTLDILEKPWYFEAKKVKTYFSEEL